MSFNAEAADISSQLTGYCPLPVTDIGVGRPKAFGVKVKET